MWKGENTEETALCWLLQKRREGRKSWVKPASLLQLAHSFVWGLLLHCLIILILNSLSVSSFCPLTQETLALPRQRDKEVEGPSLPLQISCNCRVIKKIGKRKKRRENGHNGANWAAREMIDVSCDTVVRWQLSARATFCSLQSSTCSRGPVAALKQSPPALTPLINSNCKLSSWTITSLFRPSLGAPVNSGY